MRSVNPFVDAMGTRNLLMQCTRPVDSLENACITGGILDLSHVIVQAFELKLNKATANVRYGKTLQLVATILPENATNTKVTWTSSHPSYASVSAKGVVRVKKAGIGKTVRITATTKDGTKLKDVCTIKIKKAAK